MCHLLHLTKDDDDDDDDDDKKKKLIYKFKIVPIEHVVVCKSLSMK